MSEKKRGSFGRCMVSKKKRKQSEQEAVEPLHPWTAGDGDEAFVTPEIVGPEADPESLMPPLGGGQASMERMKRNMAKLLSQCETEEEAQELLASLTGKHFDEISAMVEETPEDEALDLVEQADQAETEAEEERLLKEALELDPHCVDAKVRRAQSKAEDFADFAHRLEQIREETEKHLGEEYFAEHRGHFWGFVETRPYMRMLDALGVTYTALERYQDAQDVYERMLELNPDDNQGIRDNLRMLYLLHKKPAKVRKLNKQYKDNMMAVRGWSDSMALWMLGQRREARRVLRRAHRENPHVLAAVEADEPPRMPSGYSMGSPQEGDYCLITLMPALAKHRGFMRWAFEVLAE